MQAKFTCRHWTNDGRPSVPSELSLLSHWFRRTHQFHSLLHHLLTFILWVTGRASASHSYDGFEYQPACRIIAFKASIAQCVVFGSQLRCTQLNVQIHIMQAAAKIQTTFSHRPVNSYMMVESKDENMGCALFWLNWSWLASHLTSVAPIVRIKLTPIY